MPTRKVAQKKRVTKRTAKTKAHDAKLLAKAEREATEASARTSVAAGIEALQVPMTFGQLCALLGHDIDPDRFASTALDSLADQTETLADLVECAPDFSGDAWRLFKNVAERAKYASKVVSWLGSDKPAELPEVQP